MFGLWLQYLWIKPVCLGGKIAISATWLLCGWLGNKKWRYSVKTRWQGFMWQGRGGNTFQKRRGKEDRVCVKRCLLLKNNHKKIILCNNHFKFISFVIYSVLNCVGAGVGGGGGGLQAGNVKSSTAGWVVKMLGYAAELTHPSKTGAWRDVIRCLIAVA